MQLCQRFWLQQWRSEQLITLLLRKKDRSPTADSLFLETIPATQCSQFQSKIVASRPLNCLNQKLGTTRCTISVLTTKTSGRVQREWVWMKRRLRRTHVVTAWVDIKSVTIITSDSLSNVLVRSQWTPFWLWGSHFIYVCDQQLFSCLFVCLFVCCCCCCCCFGGLLRKEARIYLTWCILNVICQKCRVAKERSQNIPDLMHFERHVSGLSCR